MFVGIADGGRAMRWGALGSIGLLAFMGCTGPVVAQQTQSRPRLAQSYQPAPPPPNWTGSQVGGFGGGSYGSPFSFAEPGAHLCPGSGLGPVSPPCFETPFQFSGQPWSGTVGAFAGYNAQFGNLVVGVEGDAAWKRISISETLAVPVTRISGPDLCRPCGPSGPPVPSVGTFMRSETFTGSMTQRWDGSLRVRFGTLITPSTLAYGTAGGAVGNVCNSFTYTAPLTPPVGSVAPPPTTAFGADSWCETRLGYTVGAGVETAIALGYNSKLRFEYRYTDLGSFSRDVPLALTTSPCPFTACTGNAHIDLRAGFHTFRLGVGFGL
jgi:opacity protein-like surface antigen